MAKKAKTTKKKSGPKSRLTKSLLLKIRTEILKGNKYTQIREKFDLKENTWDQWFWQDYKGLRALCIEAKRERMVLMAEEKVEEIIERKPLSDSEDRVSADMTKFALETLNKDVYSKRKEHTGEGGGPITVNTINYGDNPSS